VPLVDSVLFDAVAALPAQQRLRSGKRMITDAVPEIPDWVANAPKRGFLFPYQRWMEEHWQDRFASALRGMPVQMPQWYQRWSVFVLQQWLR
jgi:asparagine synthase (glutamine-hydrolysing)